MRHNKLSQFSHDGMFHWQRMHWSEYPNQIGKWIVSIEIGTVDFYSFFKRSTSLAVADDFGNLVGVQS
jgi:hypothetical protein